MCEDEKDMKNEPVEEPEKSHFWAKLIGILLLALGNAVLVAGIWQQIHFKGVSVDSMLFQLKAPMDGADGGNFVSLYIALAVAVPALTALMVWLVAVLRKRKEGRNFFRKHVILPAALWLGLVTMAVLMRMQVFSYFWIEMQAGQIYEEEYVDPRKVEIVAPERLRNLVYIYLESMETAYSDVESGGVRTNNTIPFLTSLASEEGVCFSGDGKLNGLYPIEGATWTCGSLVSQTCGIPLAVPTGRNTMGRYNQFLPGAYSIGQVLEKFGYRRIFMQGSPIEFSGTDLLVSGHGDYTVRDYNYYNLNGRLPKPNYKVWWGFEDFRLYDFAKEEILKAAEAEEPFAVTIMTIDTHFTDGYVCPLCGKEYSRQYDNVICCADRQIESFIGWLREQDFYENTTVVIVGDHPTMDSKYYRKITKKNRKYERRAYTVILNGAVPYELGRTRRFSAVDMYPTTLAAMGFTVTGDRLGLGVNLYSEEETMIERMGLKKFDRELTKNSDFYINTIFNGK